MRFQKITATLLLLFLLFVTLLFTVSADASEKDIVISAPNKLSDGKNSTYATIDTQIGISGDAKFLYIVFWDEPYDFAVSDGVLSVDFDGKFLHRLIEIPEEFIGKDIFINFKNNANVSEIKAFSEKPDDTQVQYWESNDTVCDLLVFSTHADDEQLFFAGVLPLYATDGVTEVQIIYFTDHNNNIVRRHELLDGLWEVGVRRYPVISKFPDAYSESYGGALKNLKNSGYTEDDALKFQVEQIRKFKPLVILGHDLNGEYGHGQHILNATLLTRAVEIAANDNEYSDIPYEIHDTPKLYLHLYDKNEIELDLDTPITNTPYENFKGKTPFELSKVGFSKHTTQQGTWFKTWLNGKNGEITKASQIKKYSPCKFGLYRSTVGKDVLKNDLFENITRRALMPTEIEAELTPEPEIPNEKPNSLRTLFVIGACLTGAFLCFIAVKKKIKH